MDLKPKLSEFVKSGARKLRVGSLKIHVKKQKIHWTQFFVGHVFLAVVRIWFNVSCVRLIQTHLLSTHSMFVEFIDNFLDGREAETIQFCQVWRQKAQNSILENPCQEQKIHWAQFFVGHFFVAVVRTWFKVQCVPLIQTRLLNTHSMLLGLHFEDIENSL